MEVNLRNELKNWEKDFTLKHQRKPVKDDIKKDPTIAQKYKTYSKVKKGANDKDDTATTKSIPPPASTPKKKAAAVFKTPTKPATSSGFTPKKVEYAAASPQKFKDMLNTLSPAKSNNNAKFWTPRTKARKRLRGENVPNTPKKQRMEMIGIQEEQDVVQETKEEEEEEEDDMMNTPAKNKAFKPLFESPRPSTNTSNNSSVVVLPPLPTNTISTYVDNPQSQELTSSQATIPQSQPSQSQRGLKRGQSPENTSRAAISKKKSRTTLKYPNKVELPQSQTLAGKQDIKNEPTQLELEGTSQQISIIPHLQKRKLKKRDEESDDTDIEDYIPMTHKHTERSFIQEDEEAINQDNKVKSRLGELSLDSPGAVKRSKEYNKHIDEKVRSLLSRSDEPGYGNYRTEIKPYDELSSEEGDDDDWEEDCDGWKADGVGFIEDYDYDYGWDSSKEAEFKEQLAKQLEKIYNFQKSKVSELAQRISIYENIINDYIRTASAESSPAHSAKDSDEDDDDGHSIGQHPDDDSSGYDLGRFEERFKELEDDLAVLVADVHDLANYTKLNYTGFIKIVKKHDKQTGYKLRKDFVKTFLDDKPFYKENYDALIIQLSKLFEMVRTRGKPIQGDSAAGGQQSAFVRQTTKYWVHEENIIPLKLYILKHLPVLVYDPDKEYSPEDSAITSIYYDNEDLDFYLGRLEKTEGAEAIRLRWYGGMDVKQIFVERKTHREDWTGEKSVKARFPIKEDLVNAYMSGDMTMDDVWKDMKAKGKKSDKEIESMKQLSEEVQYRVLTKQMHPVMRSFYNRTAFQLPGDARVRISLDTELSLVREDNWDGRQRSGANWRRMDIGIDYPFNQLPSEDIDRFPYGILEVKLQTQMGQEPPEWVRQLVSSHLVEAVPKFSKFIHGCATLLDNRVNLLPFWMPQMEIDIRKPATKELLIERPQTSNVNSADHTPIQTPPENSEEENDSDEQTKNLEHLEMARRESRLRGTEDDDHDGGDRMTLPARHHSAYRLPPNYREELIKSEKARAENLRKEKNKLKASKKNTRSRSIEYDSEQDEDDEDGDHHQEGTSLLGGTSSGQSSKYGGTSDKRVSWKNIPNQFKKVTPTTIKQYVNWLFKNDHLDYHFNDDSEDEDSPKALDEETAGDDETVEYVNSFRADNGKKIWVPVRVEPKVYFANERTFLKWLQFSILLSSIAVTLLNYTSTADKTGFISAALFTFASLISISYSAFTFVWRAMKIRKREAVSYYDRIGPSILCGVMLIAVFVNFILRLTSI
ncbi:SPX-domain-containing protein [Wallemia mellicola]|uniref:DNA replication regulator SLD2 n=1 Tax=Wallemia mellicola TaxID=1708541 RepID=A0A4T0TLN8_9BASI|nr:hypothetical protein E3Q24_02142 [Wallemia mellicola]TIB81161.1 SPX-domain-containing protein [Wallemia mellicola]TIC00252.1 SPX-domain-containing protein [Wallemia mellicola]TIC04858.1 SPX-domain-containing protein [Wallemia mellicola]TIC22741.1 SPX-domain-containing protein [Wallemia mellicola]